MAYTLDLKNGGVWLPEAEVTALGVIPGAPAGDVTIPGILDTVTLGLLTAKGPSTTRLLLKVDLKLKFPEEEEGWCLREDSLLPQCPVLHLPAQL